MCFISLFVSISLYYCCFLIVLFFHFCVCNWLHKYYTIYLIIPSVFFLIPFFVDCVLYNSCIRLFSVYYADFLLHKQYYISSVHFLGVQCIHTMQFVRLTYLPISVQLYLSLVSPLQEPIKRRIHSFNFYPTMFISFLPLIKWGLL